MYQIFFGQDSVPPLVLEAEKRIISEEGRWHVNGGYFANEADAAIQRRRLAEKHVAAALRKAARLGLPECSYCFTQIFDGEETTMYAGERIHNACAHEFHTFAHGPTDAEIAEMDGGVDSTPEQEEAA